MNADIFEQMTDEEIKEYLEEQEADTILGSFEYQERNYIDRYLPA